MQFSMSPRLRARNRLVAVVLVCVLSHGVRPLGAEDSSPRRTETVQLIERCLPAVVSIVTQVRDPQTGQIEGRFGSGSVIHPAGFILTNEHVVRHRHDGRVLFSDGSLRPYRILAQFPHEDLAVIQVPTREPLAAIRLGRSHDLMLGEPTLVIGTPGGLTHSVSTGIVSGLNRSRRNESNFLPWMIQTSAAVSQGNSGGPMINALGEQIGVISTIGNQLQNVSFAIAIDHVREVLPHLLSAEERQNIWLGLTTDPLADDAVVIRVDDNSPAAAAGIRPGDVVVRMGQLPIYRGVDVQFGLAGRAAGEELAIVVRRDSAEHELTATIASFPLSEPLELDGLEPGLDYAIYRGEWEKLPAFEELQPERTGHCLQPNPNEFNAPVDLVGLTFEGLIRVPVDGLYAFYVTSDDGSALWIGDRQVVDNDGTHPARENGGLIRLKAGLHPLRIAYFERRGDQVLRVTVEHADHPKQPLPSHWLFRKRAEETSGGDGVDTERTDKDPSSEVSDS